MKLIAYQLLQALSFLKQKPLLIAGFIGSLGISVGALLAVLTLFYTLVIMPLPYPAADNMYLLDMDVVADRENRIINDNQRVVDVPLKSVGALLETYMSDEQVFLKKGIADFGSDILVSSKSATNVELAYVTSDWFDLWGMKFVKGLPFQSKLEDAQAIPAAVISYDFWQTEFAAQEDVVGQTVTFSGTVYQIVGVADKNYIPPQLERVGRPVQVWLPWQYNFLQNQFIGFETKLWQTFYGDFKAYFVGRLRPEFNSETAKHVLSEKLRQLHNEQFPQYAGKMQVDAKLISIKDRILKSSTTVVYALVAGAIGLLLITLANVINLIYSRTVEIKQRLAISSALGASRFQVFISLFAEVFWLVLISLVVGLVIADLSVELIHRYLGTQLPRANEVSIGYFTLTAAVTLLFLLSAILSWFGGRVIDHRNLNRSLVSGGKGVGIQISKRSRNILMGLQICVSIIILTISFSIFQAAYSNYTVPTDLQLKDRYHLALSYDGRSRPPEKNIIALNRNLVEAFALLPEVAQVDHSSSFVFTGNQGQARWKTKEGKKIEISVEGVGKKYHEILGISLLEGNYFTFNDYVLLEGAGFSRNVIVNKSAEALFVEGSQSIIDKRIPFGNVIGVVEDARYFTENETVPRVYRPIAAQRTHFLIHFHENQVMTREQIASVIKASDPKWTVGVYENLEAYKDNLFAADQALSIVTGILVVLTILLTGIGMYGIFSYTIQLRQREIGIRMAVGATSGVIHKMMLNDNKATYFLGLVFAIIILNVIAYLYAGSFVELVKSKPWKMLLPALIVTFAVANITISISMQRFAGRFPGQILRSGE